MRRDRDSNRKSEIALRAFCDVREGRSAEHVLCHGRLRRVFAEACARLSGDLRVDQGEWNRVLLNLRKAGRLSSLPTTVRWRPTGNLASQANAVAQAARMMERQFGTNIDRVICDPEKLEQFDALVEFLIPGVSYADARYRALTLRKTGHLHPEQIGKIIQAVSGGVILATELEGRIGEIPPGAGVYIFFDAKSTLYVGKAKNLQRRVATHVLTWAFRELASCVNDGRRDPFWVGYHALSPSVGASQLSAYEAELIASRDPEHNRAGRA